MKIHSDERGAHIRLTRAEREYLRALPKGLEPRTGHRREALKQLVAEACATQKQAAEGVIGWFDETMDAGHWFSLNDIESGRAAMLLCQFNPNDGTLEQAQNSKNDVTNPRDLVHLLQRFEDLAKSDPKPRSLLGWLQISHAMKLRYHPWIDQYVGAKTLADSLNLDSAVTADTAPVEPPPAARAGLVVNKNRARARDILDPVIELAQAACSDPSDTAAVLVKLTEFALESVAPLLDATREGIRYTRNGEDKFLTRDALDKRLHPERRKKRR